MVIPSDIFLVVRYILYAILLPVENVLGCVCTFLYLVQDELFAKGLLPTKPPNTALISSHYILALLPCLHPEKKVEVSRFSSPLLLSL